MYYFLCLCVRACARIRIYFDWYRFIWFNDEHTGGFEAGFFFFYCWCIKYVYITQFSCMESHSLIESTHITIHMNTLMRARASVKSLDFFVFVLPCFALFCFPLLCSLLFINEWFLLPYTVLIFSCLKRLNGISCMLFVMSIWMFTCLLLLSTL